VAQTGDIRRDVREHVALVTSVIERYVRRYPDQWLWLHRRWKVT
jgi:KDO2-lipid IV(A) lauroyltransferase